MSMIIVIFLTKHFVRITIEKINFYTKFCVSIEILQYKRDNKLAYQFIENFLSCEILNKKLFNFFFFFIFNKKI